MPEMKMQVEIEGDEGAISYYSRSVTLEAVFNRGLKLKRRCRRRHGLGWATGAGAEHALLPCAVRRGGGRKLTLDVSGKADRLKQFLRWCYRGPPLVGSPAKVTVKWSKA